MSEQPYELVGAAEGIVARIRVRGSAVLSTPTINRGTAFTYEEREALGLTGLLPNGVSTLEGQLRRVYAQYRAQPTDLHRWVYLASLRDRNEVLFYRLLSDHLAEMLPVVYTPTVGLAIERFSHEFRRSHGVFLCIDRPHDIEASLRNTGLGPDDVDLIVATDAEGILGIGDQGVGGIEIAIGKLAVYTAAGGIHPHRVIPVMLDTGTDNFARLTDPMYLGAHHPRVRDQRYDEFIKAYVTAATRLYPNAMLHWEDFAAANARRILNTYAEQICTFNDDIQGTAAVVVAAALTAVRAAGSQLRDQRIVIYGAGTAGMGIADMLSEVMICQGLSPREATGRIYAVDRQGLLIEGDPTLREFQVPYARPLAEIQGWTNSDVPLVLADVVTRIRPTILIGTSTQAGAFTQAIVQDMAAHTPRPIILPLSNPTSRCEARPEDLIRWTQGRALVATGSPFSPVTYNGVTYQIAQANNALVFPGVGLGVTIARARRITNPMITAAAEALARLCDATVSGAALLPPMDDLRSVSAAVAAAVAVNATEQQLAQTPVHHPVEEIHQAMWRPEYPRIDIDAARTITG